MTRYTIRFVHRFDGRRYVTVLPELTRLSRDLAETIAADLDAIHIARNRPVSVEIVPA